MKGKNYLLCIVCILIVTAGCSSQSPKDSKVDLTISAAASLKDALVEIEGVYERQSEVDLLLNFAGSGTLSKQIEQGAPVDLFFSANEEYFTSLVEKKFLLKEKVTNLLKNELILIAPAESELAMVEDINQVDRIAIGIPETVPAGKYAKEVFESLGIWNQIADHIIYAKDVRQVLSYVETGNVSAGIVYKTDAYITDHVKTISTFDSSLHSTIVYPVGVVQSTKHKDEAVSFYDFLQSEKAKQIFEKYGFEAVD